MIRRPLLLTQARRAGGPAPRRRRLPAVRVLAAVALLAACEGEAPAPTAPPPALRVGSRAAIGTNTATGALSQDPLMRWLPATPGACLVARRTAEGRYPSRSITVALPGGLAATGGATARFAYRGWAPGLPEPAVLAVCTIPDTPGAREYFATRFGSRAMAPAELSGFAKFVGVTRVNEWGTTSHPYVRQSAKPTYVTDGVVPNAPATAAATGDGAAPAGDVTTSTVYCDPNAIIPEPGCEDGGGGGGGGGGTTCDPSAIIPAPECGEETVSETPPPPVTSEPDYAAMPEPSYSVNPEIGVPVVCYGYAPDVHPSTTPQYVGRLNFKPYSECPVPLPQYVYGAIMREKCFLWVLCSWPVVAAGAFQNPSARRAEAHANTDCVWRRGWYRGEGYHQVAYPEGTGHARTYTRGAVGIQCW